MLSLLQKKREERRIGKLLFHAVMDQSRDPVFYSEYNVPDTTDGRFDLICLHAFLIMDRCAAEGKAGKKLAQVLFDAMFREMDYALREMGVGDLSVPKHMKRMMRGFNGRAVSYRQAMTSGIKERIAETLMRNLYAQAPGAPVQSASHMARYMQDSAEFLAAQHWDDLASGQVAFKPIESCYEQNQQTSAGNVRVAA